MKISISVIFPKWYHSGSDTLYEPPCLFLTTQTSPQTLFTSLFLSSFASYIRLLFTHTCPVTEFAVASHLNTANSCCHHVFLRHFRFQKCLPVNSNYISSNLIQNTLSLWVRQRFFPSIKSFHFALHISYNILHIFYNDTVIRFSQIFLNHRILCETHLTNYQNKKIN